MSEEPIQPVIHTMIQVRSAAVKSVQVKAGQHPRDQRHHGGVQHQEEQAERDDRHRQRQDEKRSVARWRSRRRAGPPRAPASWDCRCARPAPTRSRATSPKAVITARNRNPIMEALRCLACASTKTFRRVQGLLPAGAQPQVLSIPLRGGRHTRAQQAHDGAARHRIEDEVVDHARCRPAAACGRAGR